MSSLPSQYQQIDQVGDALLEAQGRSRSHFWQEISQPPAQEVRSALRPSATTLPTWFDNLLGVPGGKAASLWRYSSRLLDIVLASLALIILAPLLLVIAALVRATSPGPALFRQPRVGYQGAQFVMFKFRTMYDKSDDSLHREYVSRMLSAESRCYSSVNGLFKLDEDPRITPLGRFLRRSSLDELPQIFNILRGDMSLVGPRPALAWEVEMYKPSHHLRFSVKPGLTGLWQVSGRNKLSMNEALDLDVQYVRKWSLGLDLIILAMTLPALFRGDAR